MAIEPDKAIRHQVFDLARIQPQVTDYHRLCVVCRGCGHKHYGAFPVCVHSGQLVPHALTLVDTLPGQFHLT